MNRLLSLCSCTVAPLFHQVMTDNTVHTGRALVLSNESQLSVCLFIVLVRSCLTSCNWAEWIDFVLLWFDYRIKLAPTFRSVFFMTLWPLQNSHMAWPQPVLHISWYSHSDPFWSLKWRLRTQQPVIYWLVVLTKGRTDEVIMTYVDMKVWE